jgi:hypothetical protein
MAKAKKKLAEDQSLAEYLLQPSPEMVLVLRGHLLLEGLMEEAIAERSRSLRGQPHILDIESRTLGFERKVRIAAGFAVVSEKQAKTLLALNTLRNNLAHQPYAITAQDIAALKQHAKLDNVSAPVELGDIERELFKVLVWLWTTMEGAEKSRAKMRAALQKAREEARATGTLSFNWPPSFDQAMKRPRTSEDHETMAKRLEELAAAQRRKVRT